MSPYYEESGIIIYHADCRYLIDNLKEYSALVTDPPYGLNDNWHDAKSIGNGKSRLWAKAPEWDANPVDAELINSYIKKSKEAVVWGGGYYSLSPTRCWFAWDKCQSFRGAEFELAWTNISKANRIFRMSRIDAYVNKADGPKQHPAQKPIQLMEWCLSHLSGESICDPFMGSGTTLIAAKKMGRRAVGIELEEKYCEIAAKRLREVSA